MASGWRNGGGKAVGNGSGGDGSGEVEAGGRLDAGGGHEADDGGFRGGITSERTYSMLNDASMNKINPLRVCSGGDAGRDAGNNGGGGGHGRASGGVVGFIMRR